MAARRGREMPMFTVTGSFYARRGYWQSFTKAHAADTAATAREWALSEIGGCHGVKRHQIRVDSVTEAPAA
ncbi:MAG TPA: 50S ribosomal protein L18Ae [Thermoplasmata archaeon]|nr:50S ribosomal protein L18Ae [Thermoplasmata archaeon]